MNKHRNTARAAAITGALCAVALHAAEPTSVEERLKKLESQYEAIAKENTELKKQLGWDGKGDLVVAKPAGKEKSIKVGGYIQAQAGFGGSPDARFAPGGVPINDQFLVRRARVNVSGTFLEHFDFKAEVDLGNNSLGQTTAANWKPTTSDVFINWNQFEYANVKIGQFKSPFGYEQLLPDTKTIFAERSLPNDVLTRSRQIGAAVSGSVLDKRLSYSGGVFNGNGINQGLNDNDNFMWAGRVSGTAFKGELFGQKTTLDLGVNAFVNPTPAASTDGFGGDLQLAVGPFGFQAEYLVNGSEVRATLVDTDANGYYLTAFYNILPNKLRGQVRFETLDPSDSVSGDDSQNWVLGLTYFVKGDDIKLDVNYIIGNPGGGLPDGNRLIARAQLIF